jgi:GrpB-like predicted nucleotidyltransferase (UPF0157 family)
MSPPDPNWPSWATEPVELVAADPAWLERGRQAARSLEAVLGSRLVHPVEHVGSTAIPGLAAKPILDLLAPVQDLGIAGEVADLLRPDGWRYVPPELDGREDERFFVQVVDGHRAAHLHLMLADLERCQDILRFRDVLRGDQARAAAYSELKIRLAEQYRDDRESYTLAKRDFIRGVLRNEQAPR